MSSRTEGPVTLVVGADSVIGGALLESLQSSGQPTMGTTRRRDTVNESRPYLDLSEELVNWTHPRPVETAVLCAALSRLEDCRTNRLGSRRINVDAICALAKDLSSQGAFVIFLSTNRVFDGSTPYPSTDDPVSPATEYGRQKAEAERRISQLDGPTAIVRLTKVLGPADPLFAGWRKALSRSEKIYPFQDVGMAPVSLTCAVAALRRVLETRSPGITQVSGPEDVTYAEAAQWGARALGVDADLVRPWSFAASAQFKEPIPANNTLDVNGLKTNLGVEIPDVRWTIETAFVNPWRLDATSVVVNPAA